MITLQDAWKEIKPKLGIEPENKDFIINLATEILPLEFLVADSLILARFAYGVDLGIRIGMRYKEMQQAEIEKEVRV